MFASKIRSLTKLAFYVFTFSRRNHQVLKKTHCFGVKRLCNPLFVSGIHFTKPMVKSKI